MTIHIGWSNGVTIQKDNAIINFDPHTKNNLSDHNFFSHSHSDHTYGLNNDSNNYLTPESRDILYFKGNSEKFKLIKYCEKIQIDSLEIIAHNAGHILGSAQFEIRSPNVTVVYSGDINCRNMLTTKAAEVIPCDILILESTYGHPYYVFPRLGQICAEMVNWTLERVNERKIPVFQVYSTGKAQEVIKILNKYIEIPVVVHPIIAKVNQAYLKNEIKLAYVISNSKEGIELINKKNCVFIVPNNVKTILAQKYSTAVATGWALKFNLRRFSGAFPLSGHADFKQLVDYVKQTQPKKVFTIHGFKDSFANYLHTKLGINAQSIEPLKQRLIQDYL